METPNLKVYLDEPALDHSGKMVYVDDKHIYLLHPHLKAPPGAIPLGYTRQGAIHLLEHYQTLQKIGNMGQAEQQHLEWLINRIKKCIEYYASVPLTEGERGGKGSPTV
jgi:hypothetical protein